MVIEALKKRLKKGISKAIPYVVAPLLVLGVERTANAKDNDVQTILQDLSQNSKQTKQTEKYEHKIETSYHSTDNFEKFNHGFTIGGATSIYEGDALLGGRLSNVFTKDLDSLEGKVKIPNQTDLNLLINIPNKNQNKFSVANTFVSIDYSSMADRTGLTSTVEPIDIDGDGIADVDITNTTETRYIGEKLLIGLLTGFNIKDFLLRLYGTYGIDDRSVTQAMSVYASQPLNIDDVLSAQYSEARRSHSLQLRPFAFTDIVNLGIILGLNGNSYKFTFDDKINTVRNKQYDLGLSLDKEIENGRFDIAGIASFNENYNAPGFENEKFRDKTWEAHIIGGYPFQKPGIALLGGFFADGLTGKSGAKWTPTKPEFGGRAMLLITKPKNIMDVFNKYFNATNNSFYERHANNFSEVKKETDFLLTYVPSDEYFSLLFEMTKQGGNKEMKFGAAGNPLSYVHPFIVYIAEDLNGKRYNTFTIGGAYLF